MIIFNSLLDVGNYPANFLFNDMIYFLVYFLDYWGFIVGLWLKNWIIFKTEF